MNIFQKVYVKWNLEGNKGVIVPYKKITVWDILDFKEMMLWLGEDKNVKVYFLEYLLKKIWFSEEEKVNIWKKDIDKLLYFILWLEKKDIWDVMRKCDLRNVITITNQLSMGFKDVLELSLNTFITLLNVVIDEQ